MSAHANDAHEHHPNYVLTWVILVVLLGVSLAVSTLSKMLALFIIFGVAVVKACIVASNFMHLRFEPRWLAVIAVVGFVCLSFFYIGVSPDIINKPMVVVPR